MARNKLLNASRRILTTAPCDTHVFPIEQLNAILGPSP